jgi:hypothetical protein
MTDRFDIGAARRDIEERNVLLWSEIRSPRRRG